MAENEDTTLDDMTVDELRAEIHKLRVDMRIADIAIMMLLDSAKTVAPLQNDPRVGALMRDAAAVNAIMILTPLNASSEACEQVRSGMRNIFHPEFITDIEAIVTEARGWYDVPV